MLCRICKVFKTEDGFHPSNWKNAIAISKCRDCLASYEAARYQNGGKKHVETKRQKRLAVVNAIKAERGCMSCGESHPATLDFHHRDPMQKTLSVGTFVCRTTQIELILEEIAKCDVLCSNCHRKLHWQQRRPRKPKSVRVEADKQLRLA